MYKSTLPMMCTSKRDVAFTFCFLLLYTGVADASELANDGQFLFMVGLIVLGVLLFASLVTVVVLGVCLCRRSKALSKSGTRFICCSVLFIRQSHVLAKYNQKVLIK
jgi:hypothetical protein